MREEDGEQYLDRFEIEKRFDLSIDQIYYLQKIGKLGRGYKFPLDRRAYWKVAEIEAAIKAGPVEREQYPKEHPLPTLSLQGVLNERAVALTAAFSVL